jgi:hypothetical protein
MKRPNKPGYYWWKPYIAAKFEPVRIWSNREGVLIIHWLNREGFTFLENEDGIWGGEIIYTDEK